MQHGDDRYPHVDFASSHAQFDTSVLRNPLLSDIHLGHDFQTADDRCSELVQLGRSGLLLQDTIDAVTNLQAVLLRFDMNIASANHDGFTEDLIDQTHDRSLLRLFGFLQALGIDFLEHLDVAQLPLLSDQAIDSLRTDSQILFDQPLNSLSRGHNRTHLDSQCGGDRVECRKVKGVAHR